MKFAILFALVASAYAGTSFVAPVFYSAAQSSPGFISGRTFYSGSNFVYPSTGFVETPTTYSAVAPGNFAFRSAVIPSAVSYQSAPAAAITYSAPATTYSVAAPIAPVATTYTAAVAPVPVVPGVAPKTIAQTKGSSHITY